MSLSVAVSVGMVCLSMWGGTEPARGRSSAPKSCANSSWRRVSVSLGAVEVFGGL